MRSELGVRGTPVVPAQLEAEAGGSSTVTETLGQQTGKGTVDRSLPGLSPTAGQPERAAETQLPVFKKNHRGRVISAFVCHHELSWRTEVASAGGSPPQGFPEPLPQEQTWQFQEPVQHLSFLHQGPSRLAQSSISSHSFSIVRAAFSMESRRFGQQGQPCISTWSPSRMIYKVVYTRPNLPAGSGGRGLLGFPRVWAHKGPG